MISSSLNSIPKIMGILNGTPDSFFPHSRIENIVINKEKPSVTFEDGRNALILANAAYESFETGKSVRVDYK